MEGRIMALQAQHLEHMPEDGCGKPDGIAPIELSDVAVGQGGFALNGNAHDFSGISVSGAGDVNGDGLTDLIVGAPLVNAGYSYSTHSYVVFGKADGTAV